MRGDGGIICGMSALAGGRKRRQVTAIWPAPEGTLFHAGVIYQDADSLHVRDGGKWLRLDRRDEGIAWVDGHHLEGSDEVKAMRAAWTLNRSHEK